MRVLITGAAGFVGSHAVAGLHRAGFEVTATDLVPASAATRLHGLIEPAPDGPDGPAAPNRNADGPDRAPVRYVAGELAEILPSVMPGVEQVWHFAANADIPLGARDTGIDLRTSVQLTREVLESMREHGVGRILFPSTSGVYGRLAGRALSESDGPLLPQSMYAAGKVGCEALISAYSYTFGLRGNIFRLGNVVGGRMGRGIVRDFVAKLRRDPGTLPVLGDGRQRKSYVFVDDVIAGMLHIGAVASVDGDKDGDEPCDVHNLAAGDSLDVAGVAREVAGALGQPAPRIVVSGDPLSWPGDQPVVELSIAKALRTGWKPERTAAEAVAESARRIVAESAGEPGEER